jgi:hypothetical protein
MGRVTGLDKNMEYVRMSHAAVPAGRLWGGAMNGIDPVEDAAPPANAARPGADRGPLIATLLGSGFILLVAFRAPIEGISDQFSERLVFALGMVVPSLLIAWGVGFAISFRKATRGWKFGSLGIMAAVAILVALLRAALPGAAAVEPYASSAASDRIMARLDDALNPGA